MLVAKAIAASASAPKVYVEDVFSTWLYTGNGSTQTITNNIDLSGKGGLVWTKSRNSAYSHALFDTERGAGSILYTNNTSSQGTGFGQTFTSTGFTFTNGGTSYNSNNEPYASWTFRKQAKFFDVVTWTGSGANRTIAHNLGSVPGAIIVKRTDTTGDWQVYHSSLANTEYLVLNSTAAKATGTTRWNSTTPTSTVFSLGTDATVNASGGTYVAYLFAHDAGGFGDSGNDSVVKCGSFTCDGSGNVGTVTLGWEPQYIIAKRTDSTQNWYIWDTMRGWDLTNQPWLAPNLSNAEGNPTTSYFAPTATGFTGTGNWFGANANVVYIAIRRGPMRTPTDATKVFYQLTRSGTSATASVSGFGFPPDYFMSRARNNVADNTFQVFDRLRGPLLELSTISTAAEASYTGSITSFNQDGVSFGTDNFAGGVNYTGGNYIYHSFRRAPGFFDVVAYTGTGVARTVSHNLGVVPELMIVKKRSTTGPWMVYHTVLGNQAFLRVNETSAAYTSMGSGYWNSTTPTSSVFSLGIDADVNTNTVTYIAYLFATCPGVSKVGSYTGTGTTLQINCGFTAGARFVLIKRTDSTGDWYVWDSARGIVAGNDPYLLLNSTAAEVTNTDYVDTYSLGFELSSTAPAAINANGGSYIFLAIA